MTTTYRLSAAPALSPAHVARIVALKVLSAQERAGELPALPAGTVLGATSFTMEVSADAVTVGEAQTFTRTVAVPLTRVVGALSVEAEALVAALVAAFQSTLVSEVKGMGAARAASLAELALSTVCGEGRDPSPASAALSILSAASHRAGTAANLDAVEAAGKVWVDTFKGTVERGERAGPTKVKGGTVTLMEG